MPWAGKDLTKFESEFSMKPVTIQGYLDYDKEIKVERMVNGEKGCDVITPFYTHLNNKDEACGISVNRGWIPEDLRTLRYDRENDSTKVQGVLYRGDAKTKYSLDNQPILSHYKNIYPEEVAVVF